jgi:NitT/TauT family transport system ATP-binding protein
MPVDAVAATGARVELQGVGHGFRLAGNALPVLTGVTLRAEPGEFIALLGPSGCGKSTLLRLLAGLDRPLHGRVVVDGAEVAGPDPARMIVFQDPTLFAWRTVRQNVALGPQARGGLRRKRDRIDATLALVGLERFAGAYPSQLSGGMAQRVALARALVEEPRLLLLDEPLGKLDSLTRLTMQGELTRLWQERGFTVLMVTHDVEEALLLSSRVVVLAGSPANICADLAVDLPWPRHRDNPRILELRHTALRLLGMDAAW